MKSIIQVRNATSSLFQMSKVCARVTEKQNCSSVSLTGGNEKTGVQEGN